MKSMIRDLLKDFSINDFDVLIKMCVEKYGINGVLEAIIRTCDLIADEKTFNIKNKNEVDYYRYCSTKLFDVNRSVKDYLFTNFTKKRWLF